jgi:PAS domain S-box-containing protein
MKKTGKKQNTSEGELVIHRKNPSESGKRLLSGKLLPESEQKYRALFDNAPIGISVVDSDRKIMEANRTLEKIANLTKAEFKKELYKKRRYFRSDGTEMPLEELPSMRALIEGKPVLDVEIGMAGDDKVISWTQVSAAPIDLPERCAVVITQDITERKILQKKLVNSEAKFRSLYENSIDAILLTGPDGSIYNANPAACRMFDRTEEEICRLGRSGMVDTTDPRLLTLLNERKISGKYFGELTHIRKGGRKFPAEVSTSVFIDAEGRKLSSTIIRDITERKKTEVALQESEERHRLLMENCGLGIGYYDTNGKILMFNQVALKNLGGKAADFIGKNLKDVFGKETGQVYIDRLKRAEESEKPVQYEEYLKLGGRQGWYLSTHTRIMNQNGQVDGIQVVANEITERKTAEKRLKKSKKNLQKLARHLDDVRENERYQIALNLHDDLGQKLTALNLDIAWMKSRIGVQSLIVRKKLTDMSLMINETIEGIKEISSFLRPSILFDMGLVPAFEWQLKKFAEKSRIKYKFYYEPIEFNIDIKLSLILFRILQESLTNITRHAKASAIEVRLYLLKNKIGMLIKDNGIGIDKDKIDSMKSMGIAGIKERVRSVRGNVSIKGEQGSGTILKISVPLNRMIEI